MGSWYRMGPEAGPMLPARAPRGVASGRRTQCSERILEAALAVTPSGLGLEECLPLIWHGGQDEPDQLFIDSLGRLTTVEVKSSRATPEDLVQALSYGYQWASVPLQALAPLYRRCADGAFLEAGFNALAVLPSTRVVATQAHRFDKISSIRRVAVEHGQQVGDEDRVESIGAKVLRSSWRHWNKVVRKTRALERAGSALWGSKAFSLTGAPARMILVAPSFSKECLELAETFLARWVNMQLYEIALGPSRDGGALMHLTRRAGRDSMDALWQAVDELWTDPGVRRNWRFSRWRVQEAPVAMARLVSVSAPCAGFLLQMESDLRAGAINFCFDHGVLDEQQEQRRRLQGALRKAMPSEDMNASCEYYRSFRLPSERRRWLDYAAKIAKRSDAILRGIF